MPIKKSRKASARQQIALAQLEQLEARSAHGEQRRTGRHDHVQPPLVLPGKRLRRQQLPGCGHHVHADRQPKRLSFSSHGDTAEHRLLAGLAAKDCRGPDRAASPGQPVQPDPAAQLAADLGFAPNQKAYKKDPDAYPGSIREASQIIRVLITGTPRSPDLAQVAGALGPGEVLRRVGAVG